MKNKEWGKFTVVGSEAVEKKITDMLLKLGEIVKETVDEKNYKALVLLGGYGRGEGGVVTIEGKEFPHNNFDLILFSCDLNETSQNDLKKKLTESFNTFSEQYNIGVDLSVIDKDKIKKASCRMMWYDMRFGHKTILGDSNFVPNLKHFTLNSVPSWDARNLLVNRGTLVVINDFLFNMPDWKLKHEKLIIKHIIKAIIGYGDALLFFLGHYDWSYCEKQRQMSKLSSVSTDFKKIYDDAMNFRFRPDYSMYQNKDLTKWQLELKKHFAKIHLICESKRLKTEKMTWGQYPEKAFSKALTDDLFSLKEAAKKSFNFLKTPKCPAKVSLLAQAGFKSLNYSGILPILFPFIAYHPDDEKYKSLCIEFLHSETESFNDIVKAYLRCWKSYGDTNFENVLNKLNISLN